MAFQISFRKTFFPGKRNIALMLSLLCTIYVQGQKIGKPVWPDMGNNKGLTFYEVQQDFNQYWEGREVLKDNESEEEGGYEVYKRWADYMAPRVYPSGNMSLPSSTYENF